MKRLPVIRHVRWLILKWRVERHYEMMWKELGLLPVNAHLDYAVLDRIWSEEI